MSAAPTQAMVLAAGLGTRMAPLTDTTPKPLIRVAGKALIDYALDRFAGAGVRDAVVNVHYFAEQIERHVAERASPRITISDERGERLETGGGLKRARSLFSDGAVFCTNTDAILLDDHVEEPCALLRKTWDVDAMDALLLLVRPENASGYDGQGDFTRAADGRIALRAGASAPYVFTGLQIISTALIDQGPDGAFSTKLLWESAAEKGRLFGAVHEGDWLHVGDPDGLAAAEARLSGARA